MIFANTKERILQFIEIQGITKSIFFEKTGIKRGFLDADKLEGSVSDVFLAKIIATFPEINPEWLITGKGSMLKEEKATYYAQGNLVGGNLTQGNETTTANNGLDKTNEQVLEILQKELEVKNKIIAKLMGLEEK